MTIITEIRFKIENPAHHFNSFEQHMENMIVLLAAEQGVDRNNVNIFWDPPEFPDVEHDHMQDVVAYTIPADVDGFSCPFLANLQNWEAFPMPSPDFDNVLSAPPYTYEQPA